MAWLRTRSTSRGRVYEATWREGGIQRAERVGTDARAAAAILREKQAVEDAARGSTSATDGPDLVARYLASQRLAGRAPDTLRVYGRLLAVWLRHVGDKPPTRWKRQEVEACMAAHPAWGTSRLHMLKAVLGRLVRWARKAGAYVPDVTTGIELPPRRPKQHRALLPDEVDRLLVASKGRRYEPAVALAAFAGLSIVDVLTLRWAEVDLATGWIVRPGGRHKTGQALRVPILPELADVLLRHRPLHPVGRVCERLPTSANNRAAHKALRRLYRRAGLEVPKGEGYHLLRHSWGTLLMRAGVHQRIIGLLLSHAAGSAQTSIYLHPDDADLQAAMDALGARYRAAVARVLP